MRSGIELGGKTRLIDMHDVEANQTLPYTHTHTHTPSLLLRPPRFTREKNVPSRGKQLLGRGTVGMGGGAGSVGMHVVARVTTGKSPPSSRRI